MLTGHTKAIYTCVFSPDGINIASGGADKNILIWNVYGNNKNHTILKGHKNSILQLNFNGSSELLFSSSADNTGAIWNVEYGTRIKKIKEHGSFLNSIYPTQKGIQYYATGSDDGTAKIFDLRIKKSIKSYDCKYQCTSVALLNDALMLYTGGIDNEIKMWDTRKSDKPLETFIYHSDTITSLKLSNNENRLISNGMDGKLCLWDVTSYTNKRYNKRLLQTMYGHQHNNEKLLIKCNFNDTINTKIGCGSSDKMAYVFDIKSNKIEYKLPGHKGSVNEVDLHPLEPIIVSCSSDKTLYLGEIEY